MKNIYKYTTLFVIAAFFALLLSTTPVGAATVKMSPKKQSVSVGQTVKIKLLNNKKSVKWSVSNKKAAITKKTKAYVKVKGKKTGKCTIKAKVGKKTYSCKLTVKAAGTGGEESAPSSSNIQVIKNYTYRRDSGPYVVHFSIVKNLSEKTLDITTDSTAYNQDGKEVSVAGDRLYGVPSGCTTIIHEAFNTSETIGKFNRNISLKESRYTPVLQNLSYTITDIDGGAIIRVTNNGNTNAEFVEGYTLFLNNGKVVDYDERVYTNEIPYITPGSTVSAQVNSEKEFNEIQFYMTGYGEIPIVPDVR